MRAEWVLAPLSRTVGWWQRPHAERDLLALGCALAAVLLGSFYWTVDNAVDRAEQRLRDGGWAVSRTGDSAKVAAAPTGLSSDIR